MRQVIAPKAAAVENFGRSLPAAPMAFSLLCSSVSAVAGYSGQVNPQWSVSQLCTAAVDFGVSMAPLVLHDHLSAMQCIPRLGVH